MSTRLPLRGRTPSYSFAEADAVLCDALPQPLAPGWDLVVSGGVRGDAHHRRLTLALSFADLLVRFHAALVLADLVASDSTQLRSESYAKSLTKLANRPAMGDWWRVAVDGIAGVSDDSPLTPLAEWLVSPSPDGIQWREFVPQRIIRLRNEVAHQRASVSTAADVEKRADEFIGALRQLLASAAWLRRIRIISVSEHNARPHGHEGLIAVHEGMRRRPVRVDLVWTGDLIAQELYLLGENDRVVPLFPAFLEREERGTLSVAVLRETVGHGIHVADENGEPVAVLELDKEVRLDGWVGGGSRARRPARLGDRTGALRHRNDAPEYLPLALTGTSSRTSTLAAILPTSAPSAVGAWLARRRARRERRLALLANRPKGVTLKQGCLLLGVGGLIGVTVSLAVVCALVSGMAQRCRLDVPTFLTGLADCIP